MFSTIIVGFSVGFIIFYLFDLISFRIKLLKKRFWDNPITFFGYHIHHSFYGLIIALIGLFSYPFLVGFGLGMIISHTITDRKLIFIEKHHGIGR